MGLYTTIVIGGREGQVKLWNNHDDLVMAELNSGDNVPEIHGHTTYSIAMREGGYVWVAHGKIMTWLDDPHNGFPVFDKEGEPYQFSESYLFSSNWPREYIEDALGKVSDEAWQRLIESS